MELRERGRIADALGRLFRDRTPDAGIPGLVNEVFGDLNEADRGKMAEILTETADRASAASAFLYGVTEVDIRERNVDNRRVRPCPKCRRSPCVCEDGSNIPGP